MKKMLFLFSAWAVLFLLISISDIQAEPDTPPSIGPEIVREGDFALQLSPALGLGSYDNEIDAESSLGKAGIAPQNGWIADYPVTPDILGEIQNSISSAAEAGRISMGREEAQQKFLSVCSQLGLAILPYTGAPSNTSQVPSCENYPNPATIDEYYSDEGPPVVTYYCPPPDYYYQYAWIPYPFWSGGFWFAGFFILHDFHHHHTFHNKVGIVSNHFNGPKNHHAFRVDPSERFHGKTFAGIGAPRSKKFLSTGTPRSDRDIFNAHPAAPPWGTPAPGNPPWNAPVVKPVPGHVERHAPSHQHEGMRRQSHPGAAGPGHVGREGGAEVVRPSAPPGGEAGVSHPPVQRTTPPAAQPGTQPGPQPGAGGMPHPSTFGGEGGHPSGGAAGEHSGAPGGGGVHGR